MINRVRLRGTPLVGDVQKRIVEAGEVLHAIFWDDIGMDSRLYRAEELERAEVTYHGDSALYYSLDRYDEEYSKVSNQLAGMVFERKRAIGHQRT